jgi:hypothetical protein
MLKWIVIGVSAIIGVAIGVAIMSLLIDWLGLIPALICFGIYLLWTWLASIRNKMAAIHSTQQELLRQRRSRHEDSDDHEALRFS